MLDPSLAPVVAGTAVVVAAGAVVVAGSLWRRTVSTRCALAAVRARLTALEQDRRSVEVDPVTGLPRGVAFAAVVAAARSGPPVALLHVDLLGFRTVNGTHGRAAGDAVLVEVARRLRRAVRGADELARLGGDEFAVLLTDPDAAVDVAVRLLAVLAEPHEVAGARVQVRAAIGVAHSRAAGADLLRAAEAALARAKAAGGACVRVWDEAEDLRGERTRRTVEALRAAVCAPTPGNHLERHYQPTVDVESLAVTGVECLVRWHRDGRLVGPEEFVPLAERHGLVSDLGLLVLEGAVADLPALRAAAGHPLVLAVNVSAPQLQDPRLAPAVARAVAGLGDGRLVLEMTESVLVAEDDATAQALDALVAAGGHLTVDDFGTGYATLAYLRRRPFSAFKVDRSYVREIETDPRTRALVEGLVLLAATVGLGLVVEGVDTQGQADLLQRMGAPTQQGYLHARPQPLEAAVADLRRLRAELTARGTAQDAARGTAQGTAQGTRTA
ncbi:diguanylate cyclase (GGDEF)-like protein [Kineococcus rhizosphaerae]|uniref:Diguanylate cyclase (GGDEF)-like protein n=1 Tax=Kineococcus rhizosphaerae TaxID=559628 RepID=A0A2T0R5B8_9ACTN|nr:diguanylate cyclase (GGDEF)-like protein [Kineococcus rhizosphaerae]